MGAAGLLDILTAGHGAAHSVHADGLEGGHGLGTILNDFGDQRFAGNFHCNSSSLE